MWVWGMDGGQCPAARRIQIFQEVLRICVPMYSQEVLVLEPMMVGDHPKMSGAIAQ